jgi:hypothetical protein
VENKNFTGRPEGLGQLLVCRYNKKEKTMIKKIHAIIPMAALVLALPQMGHAVPIKGRAVSTKADSGLISGNIGFSGVVQLDTTDAATATEAVSWENQVVGASSGDFNGIAHGSAVTFAAPWTFNSGPLNDFWSVGGFTFNLLSSSISGTRGRFLDVVLTGTVTGNGFEDTTFTGTFQVANPSADGFSRFTDRLSFGSAAPVTTVPDGAYTALLLGLACAGLTGLKYKYA